MRILSIDAWRDCDGGWQWNNWFHCGDIDKATFERIADNPRALLRWLRDDAGALSDGSKGRVSVEDDGHNVVILAKGTREPLIAIEYGLEY